MVAELGRITAPTLVVVGNQDILTPRADSEEIAERIPQSELVVISGAAHGLMIEHASTFNRVVLDFIDRAERTVQSAYRLN
jgi:3-oxoadipate enol-lactonase